MAMSIFGKKEETEDAGKSVEAKFTAIDDQFKGLSTKQEEIGNTLSSLAETIKSINDRQAAEETQRLERERKAKENATKTTETKTAEQELDLLASDPRKYITELATNTSTPATKLAMITSARLMRNEVLQDKEYYYGDFKKKVDSLLENEPNLQNQNNPSFILNCYNLVLGQSIEQIQKGELKKRASLLSYADGGSDGKRKDPNEKPSVEFRNDRNKNGRMVMEQLGLTEDDLIESAKQGYHGLEVVN